MIRIVENFRADLRDAREMVRNPNFMPSDAMRQIGVRHRVAIRDRVPGSHWSTAYAGVRRRRGTGLRRRGI